MKEPFTISNKDLYDLWWGLYAKWPELEPDIFIDYQNSNGLDQFVFGYDSNEPIPGELVSIICREKAQRFIASHGFPPNPQKIKNEWFLFFENFNVMRKTIIKNPILDYAIVEACRVILDAKEANVKPDQKRTKPDKPDAGPKT